MPKQNKTLVGKEKRKQKKNGKESIFRIKTPPPLKTEKKQAKQPF